MISQRLNEPVRVVVFDWGGVILRHCRGFGEACAAAGLELRFDSMAEAALMARRALAQEHQTGRISHDEFIERLGEATGGLYSPEELRRIHDSWLLGEYPGIDGVIRRLVTVSHVETALLSNTNESHWSTHLPPSPGVAPRYPTAGLLRHRLASHLLGLAKPEAGIYEALEMHVGRRGGEILFFDDLPENIAAAANRGWRAELIDHKGDTAAQVTRHLAAHGVWT